MSDARGWGLNLVHQYYANSLVLKGPADNGLVLLGLDLDGPRFTRELYAYVPKLICALSAESHQCPSDLEASH